MYSITCSRCKAVRRKKDFSKKPGSGGELFKICNRCRSKKLQKKESEKSEIVTQSQTPQPEDHETVQQSDSKSEPIVPSESHCEQIISEPKNELQPEPKPDPVLEKTEKTEKKKDEFEEYIGEWAAQCPMTDLPSLQIGKVSVHQNKITGLYPWVRITRK